MSASAPSTPSAHRLLDPHDECFTYERHAMSHAVRILKGPGWPRPLFFASKILTSCSLFNFSSLHDTFICKRVEMKLRFLTVAVVSSRAEGEQGDATHNANHIGPWTPLDVRCVITASCWEPTRLSESASHRPGRKILKFLVSCANSNSSRFSATSCNYFFSNSLTLLDQCAPRALNTLTVAVLRSWIPMDSNDFLPC